MQLIRFFGEDLDLLKRQGDKGNNCLGGDGQRNKVSRQL